MIGLYLASRALLKPHALPESPSNLERLKLGLEKTCMKKLKYDLWKALYYRKSLEVWTQFGGYHVSRALLRAHPSQKSTRRLVETGGALFLLLLLCCSQASSSVIHKIFEPLIPARLATASHFCEGVALEHHVAGGGGGGVRYHVSRSLLGAHTLPGVLST